MSGERGEAELLDLTAQIVAAYVANNHTPLENLQSLIRTVHGVLAKPQGEEAARPKEDLVPAVPIKKSITPDAIICLEDGTALKMLKRYIRTRYNMSPEEYRAKWGLPADYPMVAPNYAERRSSLAKEIGLGRHPNIKRRGRSKAEDEQPPVEAEPENLSLG